MQTINNINKIQIPTWSWLKINDISIESDVDITKEYQHNPLDKEYQDIFVSTKEMGDSGKDIKQPMITKDVKDYTKAICNYRKSLVIPAGKTVEEPIVMNFKLDAKNPFLADWIDIRAEKGSKATIFIVYKSDEEARLHSGYTSIVIDEDADIKLVMVQMICEQKQNLDAIEIVVNDNAKASVVLVELGAQQSVASCNVELKGKASQAEVSSIYVGREKEVLDLNYRIEYQGTDTSGDIIVKGVLLDSAKKTLKSTLDFLRGASRATGREEENVMALSDKAINISCPLLLCGEDNVEGQHATSTGRPDPNKLFYLMSRGLTEREAKAMIVEASITPILDQIGEGNLRDEISAIIGGAIQHESISK